jgi:fructoselysine-6-P-deglycase FrlB-like protein
VKPFAGPLCVLGSGLSLASAELWALLHARAGHPAWALTPHAFAERAAPAGAALLLLSAGGDHPDILRAARVALASGAPVSAVVGRPGTPLGDLLGDAALLATEPLLALAARMYGGEGDWEERLRGEPAALPAGLPRPRCVVALGAGDAWPAAVEMAARVMEAGIAPAWSTDVRNFSHGQFIALAGAPEEALVVSFAAGKQRAYVERWAAALPAELRVLRVEVEDEGIGAALSLLGRGAATCAALHAAVGGAAVPGWGRVIYGMGV